MADKRLFNMAMKEHVLMFFYTQKCVYKLSISIEYFSLSASNYYQLIKNLHVN